MKLRRIAVQNLRRFTAPVQIEGLADGLNVLSAPNEQGKSTLFDGLQALFFTAHGGSGKEIKALQPHAKGAPEVLAEIETAEGRFTLAKRWLSKPRAHVWQDGRLIAQADAAEAWISQLAAADAGGPAGLLWVRQGLTGFDENGKKAQDTAREARRDLLSSIAGEVDTMTGGARMDAALKRCREELGRYATATGRPLKTGPWKAAQDRVDELQAEHDRLDQLVAELRHDLTARTRARSELAELTEPEAAARRQSRLAEAEAAHARAERHAAQLDTLTRAAETARLRLDGLESRHKARAVALAERDEAARATEAAGTRKTHAEAAQTGAERVALQARETLKNARARLAEAETELRLAQQARHAREAEHQRKELTRRIAEAEELRQQADAARREASQGPDAKAIDRLESLARALEQARALQAASAARLEVSYAAGRDGAITLDGQPLPGDRAMPLLRVTTLDLPGLGKLTVTPGDTGDDTAVDSASEALSAALRKLDLPDIDAARQSARARGEAERRLSEITATLRALAPDGAEALRQRLAALPAPLPADAPEPPTVEAAETALRHAESARQEAEIQA